MRSKCYDDYLEERQSLTAEEIDAILEHGRKWTLAPVLAKGGIVVFPHTFLHSCGAYIASAVHAALDCGSDRVIALGVLHSTTPEQIQARGLEREHGDVMHHSLRGIYGPELQNSKNLIDEYCLLSFLFLWEEEVKRRNIKAPKLYCRYPYLVNRAPDTLPGIVELEALAKDAPIVATSDFCHHGLAYGHTGNELLDLGVKAKRFAKTNIVKNLELLADGDYEAYYADCHRIKSDSFDVGTIIRYLRGPISAKLLDITIVDASSLYAGNPEPSWVAASFVEFDKK
jgi:hypothetical protein